MPTERLHIVTISDPNDSRIEPYRNQTDAWLRARHNPDRIAGAPDRLTASGLFMAEGVLVIEQLVRSRFGTESVLVAEPRLDGLTQVLQELGEGVPIYVVDPRLMDQIAGFRVHRGVLAAGIRSAPLAPDDALVHAGIAVGMEDLANHDNVGGIFRSVAGLAGSSGAVVHSERTCDPLYRKALRVSMGQVLRVPFAELDGWHDRGMERLKGLGWTTVALTPRHDAMSLWSDRFARAIAQASRVMLVVGAEGPGLHENTIRSCDLSVRVPIEHAVDSLNVTVAASISLAWVARLTRGG